MRQVLESMLADASAYPWHAIIRYALLAPTVPQAPATPTLMFDDLPGFLRSFLVAMSPSLLNTPVRGKDGPTLTAEKAVAIASGDYRVLLDANSEKETRIEELEAALAARDRVAPQPQIEQVLKDAAELRSSYGYLLMRVAVAADAQDAYEIAKREFSEHEPAMKRLESLPSYGSAEWHALAAGVAAPPTPQPPRWAPIETCPKNLNENVLVWCASNRCTYSACWDGEGWNYFAGSPSRRLQRDPTHWQPLPAPPLADPPPPRQE